ncbi:aldo/keto reductase [Nonomuraea sp. ZG12]|uniref:aldo/keto reductase n=1 Tax=Nonomuraea sp. ZG12 TaxID=3452207 RepID=UPI003F8A6242
MRTGFKIAHWRPAMGGAGTRAHLPRFAEGNVESNLALVGELTKIADALGVTVAQLAIAWVLAQGRAHDDIVALVGAKRPERIAEALPTAALELTDADLTAIEQAVPRTAAAGERYAPALLALLDSER